MTGLPQTRAPLWPHNSPLSSFQPGLDPVGKEQQNQSVQSTPILISMAHPSIKHPSPPACLGFILLLYLAAPACSLMSLTVPFL